MKESRFQVKSESGKTFDVYGERYNTIPDIIREIKDRKVLFPDKDFLFGATPHNPSWSGFDDYDDLMSRIANGADPKEAVEVAKYARKAEVEMKDKFSQRVLSVAGGGVDVPMMLSGSPECMYSVKKARVPTKVIKIAVDVTVTAGYSAKEYTDVGMALSSTIAKLEKAGYRISLDVCTPYLGYSNNNICVLAVKVKEAYEAMNYARMLYPFLDPSFFRGVSFGWISRNPHFDRGATGLGTYVENSFRSAERKMKMEEIYRRTVSPDARVFSYKDLINMTQENGVEHTKGVIETMVMQI